MPSIKNIWTREMVNKVEKSLDERKSQCERRISNTPLPSVIERRSGYDRRRLTTKNF
ncbi:hypothetical protein SIN8267_03095 [Sinobacterium norvegicum]|uniref:Uncharacterized protein n=1 Tax=Sinobacterium norvegicum TaxID=1641715 RepID=A0ABM9AIB5_9GAMM|nr:hypothetical protein [Sinobacterium norvegicum]CAH0992956.1 hypothetical protein SIN8267_03095 [Sinobacterium norvegicum]